MNRAFTVYATRNKNSDRIGTLFAKGARLPVRYVPSELYAGGVVVYGDAHGLRPVLQQAVDEERPWIYMDNGYFRAGHPDGYYSVSHGAYRFTMAAGVHPYTYTRGEARLKPLRAPVIPRAGGGGAGHVVVCVPGPNYGRWRGLDLQGWLDDTLRVLRACTDREVLVRHKPSTRERQENPLNRVLAGAYALVTYSSTAAIEAMMQGVHVFMNAPAVENGLTGACNTDLSLIENPDSAYLDKDFRYRVACNLAANQWTREEMRTGVCWEQFWDNLQGVA